MVTQATETQEQLLQETPRQETLPEETLPEETLPPSERDFDAYRLVKVEKKSTRAVAKLLRVSQTRVCQVVGRVAEYLVDVTQPEDEARLSKQLAVARQVAAEEIDYCKQRAWRSFEQSCGLVQTVREIQDPSGKVTRMTTTREGFGETRYLTTIARLAVIGSKLPTCTLPIAARRSTDEIRPDDAQTANGREIDSREIAAADSEAKKTAAELKTPSAEDCSVEAAEQPLAPQWSPADEATRLEAIKLYNRGMRMLNRPAEQLPETVHSGSTVPFERPRQTELQRKLSRRERRKQRSATAAS